MLGELFICPSILRSNGEEPPDHISSEERLWTLRKPLLEEFLIRDLHGGHWFNRLKSDRHDLSKGAWELLKKLEKQGRLSRFGEDIEDCRPTIAREWEQEAFTSDEQAKLAGFIVSKPAKESRHVRDPRVSSLAHLNRAPFWKDRSCSSRIPRTVESYVDLMTPICRNANFVAFIDPHLNPERPGYGQFIELLKLLGPRGREAGASRVEIHRVAWHGNGEDKKPKTNFIKEAFVSQWETELTRARITLDVYLWDDLHDRFIASNLMSMCWSNGFDTSKKPGATVTVTRLGRDDHDDLQKEFDRNSTRHHLVDTFSIGSQS